MRTAMIIFVLACACAWVMAQTAIAPAAGNGSFSNPYQIASLQNLY